VSDNLLSRDYEEKVYAGVLGKIIGVYLGRPFEQWPNERIERELGEITGYVNEKLGCPLIVTDDDISGTFTFLRALAENGNDPNLTPAQIGDWWRNTIIENRTILWWGGFGLSTEHTAFLRLQAGLKAPASGSIETNGIAVAEEIGSQIFIDGWGLICPGDPERAADWAKRAASVSHDGEAIYGAQVVAALVALAFTETDLPKMLAIAQSLIPKSSLISTLIDDMTRWAGEHGDDWRGTLAQIHKTYPYSRFGTNCPMVSNHAVILLALLHGGGDFSRSLMIANTAGYDTDCNSGNVGCILGVLTGLAGIEAGCDWRGPVADRLLLPTADGGRAITEAVSETYAVVNSARALAGLASTQPKDGARFHFSLPGSVQGFLGDGLSVANENGKLCLTVTGRGTGRAGTATFIQPNTASSGGSYDLLASPRLYPGQTLTASVQSVSGTVSARLYMKVHGASEDVRRGQVQALTPGAEVLLTYLVPDLGGQPVYEVGIELTASTGEDSVALLDRLTWNGTPTTVFKKPDTEGSFWSRAWVNGADTFDPDWTTPGWTYRVIQNSGVGIVTQGEASWSNYTVSAEVLPHLSQSVGLLAAGRGLRRYVALLLDSDKRVRLVRRQDDAVSVLAESQSLWALDQPLSLSLTVTDTEIRVTVNGSAFSAPSDGLPLNGAVGFLVEQGHAEWGTVTVTPAEPL